MTAVRPDEKVRTVTTPSGHQVRLAFPSSRRRRPGAGRVISVLHPNHEDHSHCGDVKVRFVGASTAEGQRLLENPGVRTWHGVRYTVNARRGGGMFHGTRTTKTGKDVSAKRNPAPAGPTLVYPRVEEIRAIKPDGQPYFHPFAAGQKDPPFTGAAKDYGLPDGTVVETPAGRYRVADGAFLVTTQLSRERA